MGLWEDALKLRFLEAACWAEMGRTRDAIAVSREMLVEARNAGSEHLAALAASNLALYLGTEGKLEEAKKWVAEALAQLQRAGDNAHLVRVGKALGTMLRVNEPTAALLAYREAHEQARKLGLRGDLAELSLMIAELRLHAGQFEEAELEIRAALPIINEEKMVAEGIAAMSLLREAVRRRQIDKKGPRDVHGHPGEQ
jgi:tetratricopeptide (TPR) repeat protein